MAWEIERKYLLANDSWRAEAGEGTLLVQGYIAGEKGSPAVRVRIIGKNAFLTIKGPAQGITRSEFEYPITVEDARYMIENFCGGRVVEKKRYLCGRWEIDEYSGSNQGLFTAEIELTSADEKFEIPAWLGEDISENPEYTNGALSRFPYTLWGKK